MSVHPSRLTVFKDLRPTDILQGQDLDFFRKLVLEQVGRTAAYAITGYADWLCYTCIRYIENGGYPDLSHIEKSVTFPEDTDPKTQKTVIDNIYFVIQDIVLNAPHYKHVPEPIFDCNEVVNALMKYAKDANWGAIHRSLEILGLKDNDTTRN